MPFPILAVAALAGTAVSFMGKQQEAEAQAAAAREDARLRELSALESERRFQINQGLLDRQYGRIKSKQALGYAKAGVSGSGLATLQRETELSLLEQINIMREEANFRSDQIRAGIRLSLSQADDAYNAAQTNAFMGLGQGVVGTLSGAGAFTPSARTPNYSKPVGIK